MRVLEISESKKEKMAEHIEKALHEMGKLMSCIENLDGGYGDRYEYGDRYGDRYDDMDDERHEMGERRRRSRRTGRYM